MIDPYGPLKDLFAWLIKRRQSQREAAEAADRLVFNVCQEIDRFVEMYRVFSEGRNAYPLEMLRRIYEELVRAIEEAKRDKVVRAAIEGGRHYHQHNPHLSKYDAHFREFDIERTLLHIRNCVRRMMEEFEFGHGPETWPAAGPDTVGVFCGHDGVMRESPLGELTYGKNHLEVTWGKFQVFFRKFRT